MRRKKQKNGMPTFDKLILPTLKALIELGGSGSIEEINDKVCEIEKIPDEILEISHSDDGRGGSEVEYRLAWSRTYLKKAGYIENSSRGVWALLNSDIENSICTTIKQI